jgi:tRNA modification GTPase
MLNSGPPFSINEMFDSSTFDIISSEIKSAWSYLGEVSGIVSDEAIIDKIFSKFCLGK